MMGLTKTAIGVTDGTEFKPPTITKSHEFLIRIVAVARLELDRFSDGITVVVFRPTVAHDGETQRSIHSGADRPANFGEFLIPGRRAVLDYNFIADFTVVATAAL